MLRTLPRIVRFLSSLVVVSTVLFVVFTALKLQLSKHSQRQDFLLREDVRAFLRNVETKTENESSVADTMSLNKKSNKSNTIAPDMQIEATGPKTITKANATVRANLKGNIKVPGEAYVIQNQGEVQRTLSIEEAQNGLLSLTKRLNLTLDNVPGGEGEFGKACTFNRNNLTALEQHEWDEGYKYAGYNVFASDRMALRRHLTDYRSPLCLNVSYPADLPQASVVIPYYKESLSALMRTVLSTLDRAPSPLLKEVILVDDFSESEELLIPLDEFIHYLPRVKVIRNTEREGLMRSRMKGVMAATAPVIVIKDAHTEYMPGWLEPLLATVKTKRSTIAISNMHVMSKDTFQVWRADPTIVHTFDFLLNQKTYKLASSALGNRSEIDLVPSPAMVGTEFAIDKMYFLEIGGYDPGLEIWGGEEMELSFKTWMCGGSMVVVPCSGVAHLFRAPHHRTNEITLRNDLRVANVWLDEYKDAVYERYGIAVNKADIGDITDRVELRKRLNCKSFDWYLREVAPMIYFPRDLVTQGEIHSVNQPTRCLQTPNGHYSDPENRKIFVHQCTGRGYDQFWMWTKSGYIRKDNRCLSYDPESNILSHTDCLKPSDLQLWQFLEGQEILHRVSGKCLTLVDAGKTVSMETCQDGADQKWTILRRAGAPKV